MEERLEVGVSHVAAQRGEAVVEGKLIERVVAHWKSAIVAGWQDVEGSVLSDRWDTRRIGGVARARVTIVGRGCGGGRWVSVGSVVIAARGSNERECDEQGEKRCSAAGMVRRHQGTSRVA